MSFIKLVLQADFKKIKKHTTQILCSSNSIWLDLLTHGTRRKNQRRDELNLIFLMT